MINNIKGLKTFEATQIRSYKVELDTNYTEGHSFVELLVDEVNSSFKALLRNGETYSYTFGAPGNDFIQFLIVTFRDRTSYLIEKLEDRSIQNFIDVEKTADNLRRIIINARRKLKLSRQGAREIWTQIKALEGFKENLTENKFEDIYFMLFDVDKMHDLISEDPTFKDVDFIEYQVDWNCRRFCEKVAPILAEVLEKTYKEAV